MAPKPETDAETVTVDEQIEDAEAVLSDLLDRIEDEDDPSGFVRDEVDKARCLLGAAAQRTDTRLSALRQLCDRDCYTVEQESGTMGDYSITTTGCMHERVKDCLSRLGFSEKTTHIDTVEDTPRIKLYVEDTREEEN